MSFELRRVVPNETANVLVARLEHVSPGVYRAQCPLTVNEIYSIYKSAGGVTADVFAVYLCDGVAGCNRRVAYTLSRQRILPVFENAHRADEIYLVLGETLLECQDLIESYTGLKQVD